MLVWSDVTVDVDADICWCVDVPVIVDKKRNLVDITNSGCAVRVSPLAWLACLVNGVST